MDVLLGFDDLKTYRQGHQELIIAGAISFMFTLGAMLTTRLRDPNPALSKTDTALYIDVATGAQCDAAPHCARILEPLIVRILPFDLVTGFYITTFAAVSLSGFLLFFVTRELGFSVSESAVGIVLFHTLGLATTRAMFDIYMVDSAAYVFILAAILLALRKQFWPFVIVITVGVLANERLLLVVPLYYTLSNEDLIDLESAKKTILVGIGLSGFYLLLSSALTTSTGGFSLIGNFPGPLQTQLADFQRGTIISTLSRYVFVPYKLLIVLSVFRISDVVDLGLRFSPYIVAIHGTLLLSPGYGRYLVFLFPFMVPAALHGLRHVHGEMNSVRPTVQLPFGVHALPFVCIVIVGYLIAFPFTGLLFRYQLFIFLLYMILLPLAIIAFDAVRGDWNRVIGQ